MSFGIHFKVPVERRRYRHYLDRLVDTAIPTAKRIGNPPDIYLRNKKTNTWLHIDISCLADALMATLPGNMLRSWQSTMTYWWRSAVCCSVRHWLFQWCWEHWARCTQILPKGWTSFQVITTYSTYRNSASPWLDGLRQR